MLNRSVSLALMLTLVCSVGGGPVFAQARYDPYAEAITPMKLSHSSVAGVNRTTSNEKLRTGLLKLVEDAKAGRVAAAERSQIYPAPSNNLSTGKKIALGVGIAAAVVVVILIIRKPRVTGPAF